MKLAFSTISNVFKIPGTLSGPSFLSLKKMTQSQIRLIWRGENSFVAENDKICH